MLWLIVVTCNRAYESHFVGVGPAEFQRVFRAFLYLTVIVAFVAYATKAEIARGFVIVALPLTLLLTLLGRYALRKQLHRRRLQGWAMSKVIVVGGPTSIAGLVEMLRADVYAGMHVVGACLPVELCDDPEAIEILTAANVPLLGDLDSIRDLVAATGADTIAVTSSQEIGADRLRWISWQLEDTPTDLVVSPGLVEVAGSRLHIRPILGLPLLHVEQPRFTGLRQVIKALDRQDDRSARAVAAVAAAAHARRRDPADQQGPGPVQADPGRTGRAPVHHGQVPVDVHRGRAQDHRTRRARRGQRDAVQGAG